jgi:hypothetical protein
LKKTFEFLEEFNDFQLEGRYPDYMFQMSRKCDKEFTKELLNKVNNIRLCLTEKIL